MLKWIYRISIQTKTIAGYGSIIVLFLIGFSINIYNIGNISELSDINQISRELQYIEYTNYAMLFFCILVSLIWVVLVKKLVVNKLKEILRIIHLITRGDYTHKLDIPLEDEIGILALSVNGMADTVSKIIYQLKSSFQEVLTSTQNLIESMDKTSTVLHNTMNSMENICERANSQTRSVALTSSTIINMVGYLGEVADSINKQSDSVEKTNNSILKMEKAIKKGSEIAIGADDISKGLSQAAKEGGEAVGDMIQGIKDIELSSQQIAEIVVVINGIADQTNLLAMNAAIEAAHAGEYGKGFAVVADEIRKLAENSGNNSKNISALIKDIVDKIANTVNQAKVAENGLSRILGDIDKSSEINAQLNDIMKEQSMLTTEILETIKNLVQITNEVQGNTKKLLSGSDDIIESMGKLQDFTNEITDDSTEHMEKADIVNEALRSIDMMINNNKSLMNDLRQRIERFKISGDLNITIPQTAEITDITVTEN